MKKGGFKFKKYYEVGIDNDEDGTETLASFDTEKEAQAFKKAYESHHPKAKLFIDSATTDFMNENKQFAKGGKTKKGKKEPMIVRGYFDDEPYEYAKGGSMDSIITDDIKQKFTEYRNKEGRKNFDAYEPILKEIESENRYGKGYTPRSGRSTEYNTLNLLKRLGVLTEVTDMRKPASKRGYYLKNNKMAKGGEIDLSGNNYRVLFTKKDSDIVYGEEIYAKSENEARKKFNNKHKGKGRTIEYISTPSAYYSDGGMTTGWCYSIGGL